ncbi:uncharacterized protein EI90DRAFT_3288636 [Cantharellus anzutake]|uniref:uncharacterized protein n=1 Tax=Cantharellus anzutake TaxID=1750568 RepID=UPI001906DE0E|nr:uncharacterized protein EI90DRAFT_3288636 [Cantharellus anzutake]KAF8333601.1 hypothetical protein EI90DRAFT_3288636 [Cantharellus anzutake]
MSTFQLGICQNKVQVEAWRKITDEGSLEKGRFINLLPALDPLGGWLVLKSLAKTGTLKEGKEGSNPRRELSKGSGKIEGAYQAYLFKPLKSSSGQIYGEGSENRTRVIVKGFFVDAIYCIIMPSVQERKLLSGSVLGQISMVLRSQNPLPIYAHAHVISTTYSNTRSHASKDGQRASCHHRDGGGDSQTITGGGMEIVDEIGGRMLLENGIRSESRSPAKRLKSG